MCCDLCDGYLDCEEVESKKTACCGNCMEFGECLGAKSADDAGEDFGAEDDDAIDDDDELDDDFDDDDDLDDDDFDYDDDDADDEDPEELKA